MTRYCTAHDVRYATGLTIDEADDNTIEYYIDLADEEIINDITIKEINSELTGKIDGSNKKFYTKYKPIADINYDSTVNTLDVTVYGWIDKDDPTTKTELSISSVYDSEGLIILETAPSTKYEIITADYSFYPNEIYFPLLRRACAYLAGYKFILKEYLLIPEKYAHGAIRFTHVRPYNQLLAEYHRIINLIISKPFRHQKTEAAKLIREEVREWV